ncbi:MAG: MarR family winged helix-turn-helix transcriptional regulator [Gammaproteobacteria bacterium]
MLRSVAKPRSYARFRDPSNSLGFLCRIGFRRFAKALENRILRHGVSSGQWRFLRMLWREEGITQSELSRRVDMREPTTVVAIQGLERRGLVFRRPDTADQRKVRVFLTPKAKALENMLIPYVAEVNAIATRGISARDVRTARKVLIAVAENLAHDASARRKPGKT